jgi:hypothetical protein
VRLYTVPFTAVALTVAQDLFYLKPAADKPIRLHSFELSNVGGTADAGDAQEELLRIEVIRLPATVTVGSGGAAVTPAPILPNDAAAGFTARANDTTVATSSGTAQTKVSTGLNIRQPTPYVWVPEHRLVLANAEALVVRLNTAPADSVSVSGTAWVEELV